MKIETGYGPMSKVSEWLKWGVARLGFLGEREARQECEQILGTLLGVSRSELYLSAKPDLLTFPRFSEWVGARKKRTPLAYLLGKAYFWEDWFQVGEGVFIPRPETEIMIEAFLKEHERSRSERFRFLDLGTGSGNIAVTIAKLFPETSGVACDLSESSLQKATTNAKRIGLDGRLQIVRCDALRAFRPEKFDVIFSNPPYVASGEWERLDPEVRCEPRLALDGGRDGLDFYRRMFKELDCLKAGGTLWIEIGEGQTEGVLQLFEKHGFNRTKVFKDLNEIERVMTGVR